MFAPREWRCRSPSPAMAVFDARSPRPLARNPPRPHRQVQSQDHVLVVQRHPQRLLDPPQPQIQRLPLEVQRPRRLGLAPARGQVRLERLQQHPRARRPVGEQRAELLLDEGLELRRVAELVQEVGDARAAGVVPAADVERGRRAR